MDVYTLPVPGSDGKTCAQIFEEAGCDTPSSPGCGACLGGPRDTYARMNEPQASYRTPVLLDFRILSCGPLKLRLHFTPIRMGHSFFLVK